MFAVTALLVAGIAALCSAQSTFDPLRPPSLPLAVKSPYLSTWQAAGSDGGNGGYLAGQWPTFWAGATTGWTGYIRVDNITYIWMGDPKVSGYQNYYVVQTGYEYTSTRSIFTLDVAGEVQMTVTFLSPILPEDSNLVEMSLPYSYMEVSVQSIDGNSHSVQLYTDISAEWVDGDRSRIAQWSYGVVREDAQPSPAAGPAPPTSTIGSIPPLTTYATATQLPSEEAPTFVPVRSIAPGQGNHPPGVTKPPLNATINGKLAKPENPRTGGVAYHKVWSQTQLEFTETNQQAQWGYWYYATENSADLTHQQGADIDVRTGFLNNGFLNQSQDNQYRAINNRYPVFAFAVALGEIDSSQRNETFQLSLHQQNCVYFEAAQGNISVPCLWTNYFDEDTAAVEYFYTKYDTIRAATQTLDEKVRRDSVAAGGDDYYSITALAVRQAFGALEYTNKPDEPWVFLKEISSDGDIQTVDVIFPFHPIAIYFNPSILKYILEPLIINQEAGYFPFAYSIHHLGPFPNATGFNNPGIFLQQGEPQPVEECGDMILMALAYAQRANDDVWLAEHYSLLRQWNEYLVNFTLIPESQLSTDDFLGPVVNDTNLALKGIVGIEAMAQIANRTGHTKDGQNFTQTAHDFVGQWEGFAIDRTARPPHTTTSYGDNNTYSVLYNLYPDAELGLQLVPQSVYEMQSLFYPTVFHKYGVPLRSTVNEAKTDWELWAAAISSPSTRNQFTNLISTFLDQTSTSGPFTDIYDTNSGVYGQVLFIARPVVGGVFSLLALQSAPTSGYVPPNSDA